jgi:hypothetical protein
MAAMDLVAQGSEGLLHLVLSLVRAPVGGVILLGDGELASGDERIEDAVGAGFEQAGVVVGGRAVDHHDGGVGDAILGKLVHQALGLQLADFLVVEGDVVVDAVRVKDQAVVSDDRNTGGFGLVGDGTSGSRVNRVEHQHLGAVGEGGFGLGELGVGVLVGVAVDDLTSRAQLFELGLEVGTVGGFVTGGLGLRQKQGDRAAGRGGRRGRCASGS